MLWELVALGKGMVVWTGVHYAAVHGYQWLCAPATLWGIATAPLVVAAPHCRGLVWLIDISSMSVLGVWTATGLLLSGQVLNLIPLAVAAARSDASAG
jgi:hypothetical protein